MPGLTVLYIVLFIGGIALAQAVAQHLDLYAVSGVILEYRFPVLVAILAIGGSAYYLRNFLKARAVRSATAGFRVALKETVKNPPVTSPLWRLDGCRFEKIVASIFRLGGFTVNEMGGRQRDGGIDLLLEKDGGPPVPVQCKYHYREEVGAALMREFVGVLHLGGYAKGVYATMAGFTKEARDIAAAHAIELWDHVRLLEVLRAHEAEWNDELVQLVSSPRPYCRYCDTPMDIMRSKRGRNTGSLFWLCVTCHVARSFPARDAHRVRRG